MSQAASITTSADPQDELDGWSSLRQWLVGFIQQSMQHDLQQQRAQYESCLSPWSVEQLCLMHKAD